MPLSEASVAGRHRVGDRPGGLRDCSHTRDVVVWARRWRMRLATAKPKRKRQHVSQLKTDEQVHAANENAVAATLNVETS